MNRRASLPGADELFRPTGPTPVTPLRAEAPAEAPSPAAPPAATPAPAAPPSASGRTRHDTKITVYLSPQELLDLEHARLRLRAEFGIVVDRGRIVREAIAELLADVAERGPDATMVRRFT